MPSRDDFLNELSNLLKQADELGFVEVRVRAGNLHRRVGGDYPGKGHRMPVCCGAMRDVLRRGDEVMPNALKKDGASFEIRYMLPR